MGLLDMMMGKKPADMLGSGMASQAAQIMQSRPYQMHVQEAKAMGQQPMSPEQFMQMMQQHQQPKAGGWF